MVVTLIGTGRLGTNLHAALIRAGHEVAWLKGRDFRPEQVRGEMVIISVKDDAIASVASELKGTSLLVVHTAGSKPMNLLPQSRRGVFYPMQTFSKEQLVDFKEISIFLESSQEEDMSLLRQLALSLSPKVYTLSSEERKFLHLAAVFACNFTNHCYALSSRILEEHGLPFDVMLPLIDQTARKVHTLSPEQAQTGPAVRGDQTIMEAQSQLLEGRMREIYHLMSEDISKK